MFTGIVEDKRPVVGVRRGDFGLKLVVELGRLAQDVGLGDSIAVDGCCLTVEHLDGDRARFHAGRETLELTTLGDLAEGATVNVERSLRLGAELGGHLVSGHVDGVAEITDIGAEESQTVMRFRLPGALAGQVIHKGSIALHGISLTLTEVDGPNVAVMLIPHTLEVTNLGERRPGDRVNVETDMVGKWIAQRLTPVLEEVAALRREVDRLKERS